MIIRVEILKSNKVTEVYYFNDKPSALASVKGSRTHVMTIVNPYFLGNEKEEYSDGRVPEPKGLPKFKENYKSNRRTTEESNKLSLQRLLTGKANAKDHERWAPLLKEGSLFTEYEVKQIASLYKEKDATKRSEGKVKPDKRKNVRDEANKRKNRTTDK